MNKRPKILIIIQALIVASLVARPLTLWAEKSKVKAQAPLKPSQEREDYQECLTEVIKKYQAPLDQRQSALVKYGIATCRDRYPAVSILIDCKKEMTVAYRDSPKDLKAALNQCRDEYLKYTFNPKSPIPFALRENLAFFAGAGLNRTLAVKTPTKGKPTNVPLTLTENWGNYSCSPLINTYFQRQPAEYLLFGNDPFVYTPLRHAKKDLFLEATGLSKSRTKVLHPELGEISYNDGDQSLVHYFPSSYCFFNRKLGSIYEGVKIYYLLDRPAAQVIPYFAVAFYSPEAKLNPAALAKDIASVLGQTYKTSEPRPGVHLVSLSEQTTFDAEGDPKNVCQAKNVSPYMAIVHTQDNGNLASYVLLANTANLCRFGDKVTSRLLKKGFEPSTQAQPSSSAPERAK